MQTDPIARELLLVGGGHSHVIVLRKLGMAPIPGLQVTLISPITRTPYSGMLPGMVAGHYSEDDIHIDLVPLCRFAGARFIQGAVRGIDPLEQTASIENRAAMRYDVLSIDIGITPSFDDVPGARDNVIPVKPISAFLAGWQQFLQRVEQGEVGTVGVVGGGAGGVELMLAIHHHLRQTRSGRSVDLHLFYDGEQILSEYPDNVRERFVRILDERGIGTHRRFRVSRIENHTLIAESGDQAALDAIFWVTSAASQDWLSYTGLTLDERGFIRVLPTLQTEKFPNIFAVGDIASVVAHPRPKAGVYAVRQGPPLAENIRRMLLSRAPKAFKPQDDFLSLISTGDKYAVAARNGRSLEGVWVWHWKDWIDRRFMDRFSKLPAMPLAEPKGLLAEFDTQMMCGGCGSKVSAELLNQVLDELGSGPRDDAAEYTVPPGKTMLHSVDYFRQLIDDPVRLAQIAVTHALGDIYAMGGQPVTALAMLTVPYAKPSVTKGLLQQLLSAAISQLQADGVALVGGHTTEGMELSIGFAVNGVVNSSEILRKSGLLPGQVFVLTKALGTGTLFAADMQGKARGEWIAAAVESMIRSNREAMSVLRRHHVSACTDVTGFGLAGHLLEMLTASHCGASIDLEELPVLQGSNETLNGLQIRSTLHEGNRLAAFDLPANNHPAYELLFDPQTAGGLLASIPRDQLESCLQSLRAAGYTDASCIGEVTEGYALTLHHP